MPAKADETQVNDVLASSTQAIDVVPPHNKDSLATFYGHSTRPKIMMIDDEKLNSYVVAEYLRLDGYRDLIHTEDPVEALSLARSEYPAAILLDIHMPRLNGLDLLQQIRADDALAHTPIIILTASRDDEVKALARALGATDFLQKPIRGAELLACLRNVLTVQACQDSASRSKSVDAVHRQGMPAEVTALGSPSESDGITPASCGRSKPLVWFRAILGYVRHGIPSRPESRSCG
jgi:CheY-like chemotaxis protein